MADINRITLMMRVDDTAHADIALTPDRSYYRFATDSSIEDGELGAIADFDATAAAIVDAAMPRDAETPLPPEMRFQLFVNNRLAPEAATEQSLRRVIAAVSPLWPEFSFIEGFK